MNTCDFCDKQGIIEHDNHVFCDNCFIEIALPIIEFLKPILDYYQAMQ